MEVHFVGNGRYLVNDVVNVLLADRSQLECDRIAQESLDGRHFTKFQVHLGVQSRYSGKDVVYGGGKTRCAYEGFCEGESGFFRVDTLGF